MIKISFELNQVLFYVKNNRSNYNYIASSIVNFFQVFSMVEEETRRYRPTKNYLENLPTLNLHAFEVSLFPVTY